MSGESVEQVLAGMGGQDATTATRRAPNGQVAMPSTMLPSTKTTSQQAPRQDPSGALLDYLLGDGN
jgi:hypothetical protein